MKKNLLFLVSLLISTLTGFTQASFNTGVMEVDVNNYGRIRIYDANATRHLQRASILVGENETGVFDYYNDSEELEPTVLVDNPLLSTYEIYGAYDNAYSGLPPAVTVRMNAYGFENAAYLIVKFNITNTGAETLNALAGLEIIPEINGEYGFDTVTFNWDQQAVRFHRGAVTNMGTMLLSSGLTSLYSFEWYDEYQVDSDFWNWMNTGTIQAQYASNTVDGPVTITAQDAEELAPSEAYDVYYAFAIGATEQEMLQNLDMAMAIYSEWIGDVGEDPVMAPKFSLDQNCPNPVSNSTTISYRLPESGFASMKVYNSSGIEVATLVNGEQAQGAYSVEFDASGLESGIYFCRLMFEGKARTIKLMVTK
ncbi:MAG: T9SS type A sorting domain-containing protein [Bacteroidales bacterium]|jgi:hypothetical protein|nr:T9SS type A sorting domain-containing protein [Bacteroidales bacterium]